MDALTDGHAKVEAASLYARRSGIAEQEIHFAKLRLLVEAALGVLSYDDPDILDERPRAQWRALAAAYEHGRLFECCANGYQTSSVVAEARRRGYTYATRKYLGKNLPAPARGLPKPYLPWAWAREIAMQNGVDLKSIPPCAEYIKRMQAKAEKQARARRREHVAAEKWRRTEGRKIAQRIADQKSDSLSKFYSSLRLTLEAAEAAVEDIPKQEHTRIFSFLYEVEDITTRLIKMKAIGRY